MLLHLNATAPLVVSCDGSSVGVGAVLTHCDRKGNEQPAAYVSRTPSIGESNWTQIDREAFAVIFGMRYFRQYLYGKTFLILPDHEPLLVIFKQKQANPALLIPQMLR